MNLNNVIKAYDDSLKRAIIARSLLLCRLRTLQAAEKIRDAAGDAQLFGLPRMLEKSGMSARAVAEKIGVGHNTLISWKNGKNWPSAYYLPALAVTLSCSIEDLYLPEDPEYE